MIQIILQMRSCDQSLVTLAFLSEKLLQPQFYKDLKRKTIFFEGWSWFRFNNQGLALDTGLKFYTSVVKGLKLKVRKFQGLIPTFVEVTGEKLVREGGAIFAPSSILNRVKACVHYFFIKFLFFHQMIGLQKLWKVFLISTKKFFSFSIYSNFCNFSSSFPHLPDLEEQIEVE